MSLLVGAAANSATGYNIDNSLRFRASADAYLSRVNGSAATLATSGTISMWVKKPRNGSREYLMQTGSGTGNSNYFSLFFTTSTANSIKVGQYSVNGYVNSTNLYRDPSAWYHIVMAFDSTESTGTDRVKIYVNGDLTTNTSSAGASSNFALTNNGQTVFIGREGGYPSDTYMSEVHLIDGQTLAATDFGEYDEDTGAWIPKRYTGTYGNNGFYLKFDDTSSVAALGTDSSGNGNDFTPTNISLTAGTTYDSMTDVPTLTNTDTSNFATLNPLVPSGSVTINQANLKATSGTNAQRSNVSTISVSSGKYYWETTWNTVGANDAAMTGIIGVNNLNPDSNFGGTNSYVYVQDGGKQGAGSYTGSYGDRYVAGDVIGTALDLDANTITFYRNGTTQGTAFTSLPSVEYYLGCSFYNSGDNFDINFGQRPFAYTPPTGYKKLNTFNLPDSTIVDGSTNFNTILYAGNSSTNAITDVGFQPDLVWYKRRTGANDNTLIDSVRGGATALSANGTAAEYGFGGNDLSFTSTGFTLTDPGTQTNASGQNYVAWNWKAGGTAVSNSLGDITTSVSANTTAGFSIVTWTKNGGSGARTIGHGLGGAPELVFFKEVDDPSNWSTYVGVLGNTSQEYWYLNLNVALPPADSNQWSNTAPTSTLFTYNQTYSFGSNSSAKMVGYFFRSIEGYSKISSYTGNGSSDGTFIYTGFRPSFVMIKRIDSAANWYIYDTSRGTSNAVIPFLNPNNSDAEQSFGAYDFLSNGFKNRQTNVFFNASGGSYMYMAFAENPFKNSNAR